jgi:hypothetical protein
MRRCDSRSVPIIDHNERLAAMLRESLKRCSPTLATAIRREIADPGKFERVGCLALAVEVEVATRGDAKTWAVSPVPQTHDVMGFTRLLRRLVRNLIETAADVEGHSASAILSR